MGKFSRGSQLGDSQRAAGREQRQRQIAERNKLLRRQKTRSFAKKGIIFLAILAVLVIIFDRQFVHYKNDSISEPYLTTVNDYFDKNPLRKSKLFFSSIDLENYVISKHPEVQGFSTNLSFFTNDTFAVTERQPAFVWQIGNSNYLGDSDGILYDASEGVQTSDLLIFKDQSAIAAKPGDKVLSKSTLDYVKQINEDLKTYPLKPSYYSVPAAAREIHIYFEGKPYYVKFSLDRSVVGQLDELKKTYDYITKSNTTVRNYIDLRTEDKAYYQ